MEGFCCISFPINKLILCLYTGCEANIDDSHRYVYILAFARKIANMKYPTLVAFIQLACWWQQHSAQRQLFTPFGKLPFQNEIFLTMYLLNTVSLFLYIRKRIKLDQDKIT